MNVTRPNPDDLLIRMRQEAAHTSRGHLKIFLGAAAGVGKTFAMLQAARIMRKEGRQVLVGVVETHGRSETGALLEGMDVLPRRRIEYRGASLQEFDLDAALKLRPPLILVDELAHSNVPGSRHAKRWQDVEELLAAGIDVYTTLNIQHIDSLNDVVAQVTGIRISETVPDTFFDRANEVELVDLPPEELLQRLREGKVYVPDQAQRAIENFFRKGNLIALRELALRRTADHVDVEMRDYREHHAIAEVWPVRERIMVCIGAGAENEKLIRFGKRMADYLRAEWLVVYIETPKLMRLPEKQRDVVARMLRLAETLGAEPVTLNGAKHFSEDVLACAYARNVSRIVMGKPRRSGWRRWIFGSVVDAIVAGSGAIDVNIVSTGAQDGRRRFSLSTFFDDYFGLRRPASEFPSGKPRSRGYLAGLAVVALCTALAAFMHNRFALANIIMVYLLGVVVVAVRYGSGPSVLAAVLSVASFDFFFVKPYLTFAVADTQFVITFTVMLVVGLVISRLTASVRLQARVAAHREQRTAALYAMSRELAATRGEQNLLDVSARHVAQVFAAECVVLVSDVHGHIQYPAAEPRPYSLRHADLSVAQWVHDHDQMAGRGTDTLPGTGAVYLPLRGAGGVLGVLALLPKELGRVLRPEQRRLLETFAGQVALALERINLSRRAAAAQIEMETERLRNSLLSSISHDLRTPLAAIIGASSSILERESILDPKARLELARDILATAERMNALVGNVLDLARLESGSLKLNRQWYPLEELIGSTIRRLKTKLTGRTLDVKLPENLPWLSVDGGLIEQVLVNLLENALKYTPLDAAIQITAGAVEDSIVVEVADRGPGLPPGSEEEVFKKFYRGQPEGAEGGVGLGLAICRVIVEAHGGRIWAQNREHGGARFKFMLPAGSPPSIEGPEDG
jgi:two-component system, OmpR family, sensor histidine kinase KdpD